MWHGPLLCIEHALGITSAPTRLRLHRWLLTFIFVVLGWVMFRSGTALTALYFYQAMFSFE